MDFADDTQHEAPHMADTLPVTSNSTVFGARGIARPDARKGREMGNQDHDDGEDYFK